MLSIDPIRCAPRDILPKPHQGQSHVCPINHLDRMFLWQGDQCRTRTSAQAVIAPLGSRYNVCRIFALRFTLCLVWHTQFRVVACIQGVSCSWIAWHTNVFMGFLDALDYVIRFVLMNSSCSLKEIAKANDMIPCRPNKTFDEFCWLRREPPMLKFFSVDFLRV